MEIENQIQKDFLEIKKIKEAQAREELIEQKTQEWMTLSSQYNDLLYQAIEDESKLEEAVPIKAAMIAKQAEIDALRSP